MDCGIGVGCCGAAISLLYGGYIDVSMTLPGLNSLTQGLCEFFFFVASLANNSTQSVCPLALPPFCY
jgi:hypothetical protein